MTDYILVLKALMRNSYRGSKRKNTKSKTSNSRMLDAKKGNGARVAQPLLMALGMLPLGVLFGYMGYISGGLSLSSGVAVEMFAVVLAVSQVITFFFGASSLTSTVFMANDSEFLLSLPVKPLSVFFAKFTVVYLNELSVTLACLVPISIGFGLGTAISGVDAALFYCLILPIALLAPLVPLVFLSIISAPLLYVVSFLKKRSATTTIVAILVTLLGMGMYFALYTLLGNSLSSENIALSEQAISGIRTAAKVVYPYLCAARAAFGVAAGANFAIYLAIVVVALGLATLLCAFTYRRSVASQLESTDSTSSKEIKTDSKSVVRALLEKDFKTLLRNPSLAINSFLNIFVAPLILLLFLGVSGSSILPEFSEDGGIQNTQIFLIGFIMFYSIMLTCGMNYVAFIAFTREGKTFYINRYIPVEASDVLREKSLFADIDSVLGIVLIAIVSVIFLKINLIHTLFMVVSLVLYAKAFNTWGVYRDMKKPNFEWTNVNEAVKRNFYVAVPMFVSMGIGICIMVIALVIAIVATGMSDIAQGAILWSVNLAIAIAMLCAAKVLMKKHGEELFYKMGEN